jgi:hypothetical protein
MNCVPTSVTGSHLKRMEESEISSIPHQKPT